MHSTNYDTWLMTDPGEQSKEEYLREQEIERIMDEYNIDYDEAEEYFEDSMKQAEEDNAASLAEDLAYFDSRED